MITGPGPCCPGPQPDPEFYGRMELMTSRIYLRNTISGVVEDYDAKTAERFLKLFPHILVVVDSAKPEVLSGPYTIEPKTSKRKRITEPAPDVSDVAVEDAVEISTEDKDN